jgi:hypothetical protein
MQPCLARSLARARALSLNARAPTNYRIYSMPLDSFFCDTRPSLACNRLSSAYVSLRQLTSAYVSLRQRTSAYVSIRQHTPAYVSIRQHTSACILCYAIACHAVVSNLLGAPYTSSLRPHTWELKAACTSSVRPHTLVA